LVPWSLVLGFEPRIFKKSPGFLFWGGFGKMKTGKANEE